MFKASAQYNWQLLGASPQNGQKQDDVFFINPNRGWSVNGSGRVFRTTDGGATWAQQWQRPGSYFRCIGFIDTLNGFLGNIGPNYFPGVTDQMPLYRTTDGGQSWQAVPPTQIDGPMPAGLCAIQVIDPQHIVAAGRVGGPAVWMRSEDGGATWTSASLGAHIQMITDVYFSSPDTGYVFGGTNANIQLSNARIIRTTDGGATWTTVYTGERTFELCWKASFPTAEAGYATLLNYAPNYADRYLAKTLDGGATWQELPFVNNGLKAFGIGFLDANTGWVGADTGGYETLDGGATWTPRNLGGYANKIRLLPAGSGWVGYAIGQRIYKLVAGDITSSSEAAAEELRGLKATAFPNPARRELNVRFHLEEGEEVEIALYDAAGRQLDVAFRGFLPAGEHTQPYTFTRVMPGIVQVMVRTASHFQVLSVNVLP